MLDYGSWFGFIARGMHSVLSFLFGIGMPYWLAIISLTVMVRLMFGKFPGCDFAITIAVHRLERWRTGGIFHWEALVGPKIHPPGTRIVKFLF